MLGFLEYLYENDDEYYYHVTKGKNMTGIGKEGLKRRGTKSNFSGLSKKGMVYLTNKKKHAEEFLSSLQNNYSKKGIKRHSARLIRVHKSKINHKLLRPDDNAEPRGPKKKSYKPSHFEYHGDIPVKHITFSGGEHYDKG